MEKGPRFWTVLACGRGGACLRHAPSWHGSGALGPFLCIPHAALLIPQMLPQCLGSEPSCCPSAVMPWRKFAGAGVWPFGPPPFAPLCCSARAVLDAPRGLASGDRNSCGAIGDHRHSAHAPLRIPHHAGYGLVPCAIVRPGPWAGRFSTAGGAGGSIEPPKTGGGGLGKRA